MIKIKHRHTNAVLFECEAESLRLAVEQATAARANLADAYLADAYLAGAYLAGANLAGANLAGANLARAYLARAYLARANLAGAKGIRPELCTPLLILAEQVGAVRAYKLVTAEGEGPYNGGITYEVGGAYEVEGAETSVDVECGPGISLASLDWCMREWCEGYRILVAEFDREDLAAIPTATDGKFRVHRCRIVSEKNLEEIGLVEKKGGHSLDDPS